MDIFDNYCAMPYGHVESDVYSNIPFLNKYRVENTGTDIIQTTYDFTCSKRDQERIDSAIESLKEENKNLINYGAFKLVELSHQWYSWINMYNLAKMRNKNSIAIPKSLIQNESKLFQLEYASL